MAYPVPLEIALLTKAYEPRCLEWPPQGGPGRYVYLLWVPFGDGPEAFDSTSRVSGMSTHLGWARRSEEWATDARSSMEAWNRAKAETLRRWNWAPAGLGRPIATGGEAPNSRENHK